MNHRDVKNHCALIVSDLSNALNSIETVEGLHEDGLEFEYDLDQAERSLLKAANVLKALKEKLGAKPC